MHTALFKYKPPPIIDVEASGFGKESYPIEVGFVLEDGDTYCCLIQPLEDWNNWNRKTETIHGITRNCLKRHGKPAKEVAEELNEKLFGKTVYSDAWGNDSSWLSLLFYSVDLQQQFKLESLRTIISEEQTVHWHKEKDRVSEHTHLQRHRASSDALIIQKTYINTFELVRKAIELEY